MLILLTLGVGISVPCPHWDFPRPQLAHPPPILSALLDFDLTSSSIQGRKLKYVTTVRAQRCQLQTAHPDVSGHLDCTPYPGTLPASHCGRFCLFSSSVSQKPGLQLFTVSLHRSPSTGTAHGRGFTHIHSLKS